MYADTLQEKLKSEHFCYSSVKGLLSTSFNEDGKPIKLATDCVHAGRHYRTNTISNHPPALAYWEDYVVGFESDPEKFGKESLMVDAQLVLCYYEHNEGTEDHQRHTDQELDALFKLATGLIASVSEYRPYSLSEWLFGIRYDATW